MQYSDIFVYNFIFEDLNFTYQTNPYGTVLQHGLVKGTAIRYGYYSESIRIPQIYIYCGF